MDGESISEKLRMRSSQERGILCFGRALSVAGRFQIDLPHKSDDERVGTAAHATSQTATLSREYRRSLIEALACSIQALKVHVKLWDCVHQQTVEKIIGGLTNAINSTHIHINIKTVHIFPL